MPYIPKVMSRRDGGRGLLGVEGTVHIATDSLQRYVKSSTERLLSSLTTMEDDEFIEPEGDLRKQEVGKKRILQRKSTTWIIFKTD